MADELAALIIQGAVHLPPIEVIPWQEIPAGLDRLAKGQVRGKISHSSERTRIGTLAVRIPMTFNLRRSVIAPDGSDTAVALAQSGC
jgi:hypothetical protein